MNIPPAIFFINSDITYPPIIPIPEYIGADPPLYVGDQDPANQISELTNLQQQLLIDDTITKQEFDARVAANPNYPRIVHLQGLRVLVILTDFHDQVNRELADVVLFIKQGLASVEKNKFCEPQQPRLSLDIQRLNIYTLLRFNHSKNVVTVPAFGGCCEHGFPWDRQEGAFGKDCGCRRRNGFYKWIPENQPGKPPYDPEEGE